MKKQLRYKLNLQQFAGETLAELMQSRSNIYDQQKAILNNAESEGRDLTSEEEEQFQTLENQFAEADRKVKDAEAKEARVAAMAARGNELNGSQDRPFRPSAVAGAPIQITPKDDGGFKNLGELVHAIRFGDNKGRLGELPVGQGQGGGYGVPEAFRGQLLPSSMRNEWSHGDGASGGYAVPEQFKSEILSLRPESAIVRSRANVLPAGDPPDAKITMPALDQGSKGVYGGVEVAWIEEGANKPETDAHLSEVTLQPHEVAATTVITDKLLRNWAAANTFISNLLQSAMMAAEDIAFLTGSGTGKPSGVLGAAGAIAVNREAAERISYLDTLNMRAVLLPESIAGAVWVANLSALPQIATLQDPAGNYIFIQGDATKGIPATLGGIPIMFTGKTPTLGKKGDLMLLDLSYYLIKDGSGPFIAASEHVLFRQNKTVIKVFWNVDGKPWVVEPLALEDGVTKVTPYVVLDIPKP
ncbi:phage major capsid protein, HK97 family [Paenibacillus dendritiformis C454]|uniref:Phage major capsid protein, HK97 family n=1 Tax=Paenibacillus dendritiformis C454 TaxID=1131935 RepID=H3SBI8_9BACL|nr:phage major capsid protein [Paenibacillus dendritiformis]EHQ63671.1 phage major capsid protein, HK97 family [Paenibacillus dendritiformis C454]